MLLTLVLACDPVEMYHNSLQNRMRHLGFEQRTFSEKGHEVAYWIKEEGGKEPLVLLHGFGGSGMLTWFRILGPLSKDRPMLVPDLLWFGQSTSEHTPSLRAQQDAFLALLQQTQWQSYDLLGTSYGGFVALSVWNEEGENIDQLILVDSPGGHFSQQDIEDFAMRFNVKEPRDVFIPQDPSGVQTLIDLCYYKKAPQVPKVFLPSIYERNFTQNKKERGILLDELPRNRDMFRAWPERDTNVHVFWGEFDPVFPLEKSKRIADSLSANLHVIPNAAHAPYIQYPKLFSKLLLAELD